jgi:uncharacterized protein (UPF0262 family)
MTEQPQDEDPNNRIVAVTLDEESIGRSGPDIEHERAIAIYDLIEQNLFAPEGQGNGPFTLECAKQNGSGGAANVETKFSRSRSSSAWRSVISVTPNDRASARWLSSRMPGVRSPSRIRSRSDSAIR